MDLRSAARTDARAALVLAAALAAPAFAGAETAPAVAATQRTVADWYGLGGWIMHLLAGCSVGVGAIVLERLFALRRSAVAPPALTRALLDEEPLRATEIRARCVEAPSSLARMVRAGLSALQRGADHPLDHVAIAGETEGMRLRRNLGLLAALANVATMLGLLGTVLGMIAAFDRISEVGTGDARVVARGIFQALVTTAAGLSVGITALAGHALLRRRVEAHLLTLERVVHHLFGGDQADPATSKATELAPAASTPR